MELVRRARYATVNRTAPTIAVPTPSGENLRERSIKGLSTVNATFNRAMPPFVGRAAMPPPPRTFDFTLNLSRYVLDPQTGEPVVDNIGRIDDEGAYIRALPEQLGLRLK